MIVPRIAIGGTSHFELYQLCTCSKNIYRVFHLLILVLKNKKSEPVHKLSADNDSGLLEGLNILPHFAALW
jgi:hypothetical protein